MIHGEVKIDRDGSRHDGTYHQSQDSGSRVRKLSVNSGPA